LKKEIQSPLYYSAVGLSFLFVWLSLAYLLAKQNPTFENTIIDKITIYIYRHFISWKAFSMLCFILGLKLYYYVRFKDALIKYLLIILISSIFLLSFFVPPDLLTYPTFKNIIAHKFDFSGFVNTSNLLTIIFGSIVVLLGYLSGQTNWLKEYHFHYYELKKLFKYSLGLLAIWLVLNFFDAYFLISKWHLGETFLIIDGLVINVLLVYIYLFLLISFENFKLGKTILNLLQRIGKLWILQFLILAFVYVLLIQINYNLNFNYSLALCFFGYLFSSAICLILDKIVFIRFRK